MLILGIGAAVGITPVVAVALAGYLWALLVRDFVTGWLGVRDRSSSGRPGCIDPAGPGVPRHPACGDANLPLLPGLTCDNANRSGSVQ